MLLNSDLPLAMKVSETRTSASCLKSTATESSTSTPSTALFILQKLKAPTRSVLV